MEYLDFELEVVLDQGRDCHVAVIRSPAGEARVMMHFPFDDLALQMRLKDLQIALLRSGGNRRKALTREEQTVQDFGRDLFDALVAGEVRNRFDVSQHIAETQGKGLRIKLRFQTAQLAALPWEFLYDSRRSEYLCLSAHTPLVRYLELPQPPQPLTITPPLKILGMIVSPTDLNLLDTTREKLRVDESLKPLLARGAAQITWLQGQTWRDLQKALRSDTFHIFHFIGHGGFDAPSDEGQLVLADENNRASHVTATQLSRLLADYRSLRLVVLNACEGGKGGTQDIFSSTASILVRRGLPAVLAMQYEITDKAAIEFARAFYESLAEGFAVDASVSEARIALTMAINNTIEWGTPILFMRAPDGILFNVQAPPKRFEPVATPKDTTPAPLPRTVAEKPKPVVITPRDSSDVPDWLLSVTKSQGKPELVVPSSRAAEKKPEPAQVVSSQPPNHLTTQLPNNLITQLPKTIILEKPFRLELVLIPDGEFLMGSDKAKDKQAYDDELPQHKLTLPNYYIAKYPVTNAQYAVFAKAAKKNFSLPSGKNDHPVVSANWRDAVAFCKWLQTNLEGLTHFASLRGATRDLQGFVVRLPTEAQWEKAARGTDGRIYPWGNEWDVTRCNTGESKIGNTTPVGKYSPRGDSPYGIADMIGNVWEWTNSKKEKYPYKNDQREDGKGDRFVVRGGAWNNVEVGARCASRLDGTRDFRWSFFGIRVVAAFPASRS